MHINHVFLQNERSHGEAFYLRGSWSVTQTDREVGFAHINSSYPDGMVERSKTMLYIAGRRCEPIVPMHAKNRPGRGTREAVALKMRPGRLSVAR